jgi:hypothetical protein
MIGECKRFSKAIYLFDKIYQYNKKIEPGFILKLSIVHQNTLNNRQGFGIICEPL